MTPFIASLHSCVLRKSPRLLRTRFSGKLPCFVLGLFVTAPAFAEGTDVSTEEFYSDDATVTTWDGEPLDINGDTFVDLAVASNSADVESRWYPGNGDGTFGAPVLLRIGTTSEVLGADFDGDMFVDLVQARRDDTILLYLNTAGTGVSAPGEAIGADTNRFLAAAVGDLDGDGDLDLVAGTGHQGGEPGENPLQRNRFYVNNGVPAGGGAPAFTGGDISDDEDDTRSIALADIDGDGKLDAIAGNDETTDPGNLIYPNTTVLADSATFGVGVEFGADVPDDQTSKILVGDLNGDAKPDIVVLNFIATAGGVTVSPGINRFFLNESLPGVIDMGATQNVSEDAHHSSGGALADFDGDGDLDIAVANLTSNGHTGVNRLYLNQFIPSGTVSFVGSDITADDHQSRELAAGDVNDDGHIDIVVANQPLAGDEATDPVPGRDRVYLNNGTEAPFTDAEIPSFTSTQVTEATIEVTYTYNVTATDPEDDPIAITAPTLPEWLELTDHGDGTATLTGTPAASDVGDHAVSLEASDDSGNSATQDFTITVSETPAGNSPPEFTSTAVTAATEDEAYTYDITVSDDDSADTLTIEAATVPGWLTLTDNGDGTATLTGTPEAGDVGDHDVSLQVSDGTDTATQDFTITVEATSSEPPPSEPPPDEGGDSGGGSLGLWSLLALIAFGAAGRRRRNG